MEKKFFCVFEVQSYSKLVVKSSVLFEVQSFEVGSFEVGSFEVGSFEVGSFEVGSFEVQSYEVGSFEVQSFEVQSVNPENERCRTELFISIPASVHPWMCTVQVHAA
jgi:hypothetical protein